MLFSTVEYKDSLTLYMIGGFGFWFISRNDLNRDEAGFMITGWAISESDDFNIQFLVHTNERRHS